VEDIRCCCCFSPIADAVQERVQAGEMDRPWRCERCGALFFVTRDVEGVSRAARLALGADEAVVEMRMDVAGPGVHLVCAWNSAHTLNASQLARILNVNLSHVLRLIERGEFPHVQREGHAWRIPLRDVRAYLLRRAVRE